MRLIIATVVFFCFAGATWAQSSNTKQIDYSNPATIRRMALGAYKTPTEKDAPDTLIDVSVPKSTLKFDNSNLLPKTHNTIEITTSTWVPKSYSNDSYADNTTTYDHATLPKISLNVLTDGWQSAHLSLKPVFGFSFEQLSRTGTLPLGSGDVSVVERLNFYSLRAGFQLSTAGEYLHIKPILGVALLPSWQQASSSAFSNGISKTSTLVEGIAGASIRILKNDTLGMHAFSIELGAERTQDMSEKTLAASAMFAGLRAEM